MVYRPFIFRRLYEIMVSACVILWSANAAASDLSFTASPPSGFSDVEAERQLLVDLYFGGRKIGQTSVTVFAGRVGFDDPATVVSRLPALVDSNRVLAWLSEPLTGNFDRACGNLRTESCGFIEAEQIAIILDEDRFRVDLFLAPAQFATDPAMPAYLDPPQDSLSLISRFAANFAAGAASDANFHLQNHTIIAVGGYRLRADSSVLPDVGMAFDNASIERDFRNTRLAGGLFWATGGDFLGRRKIVGGGLASQIDTRSDRRALTAAPLSLALTRTARVDLFIDGRLMSSRVYSAGQVDLDTTALPEGSYEVVLKIHEASRSPREERRFFTKGADIAPPGRPMFGAFVGLLADARGRPDLGVPFYTFSAAVRLGSLMGIDARIAGTDNKAVGEFGGVLVTRLAKIRGSALVSSSGDYGFLARVTSAARGPLSVSFDLRTLRNVGRGPLLPESGSLGTFSEDHGTHAIGAESYTQGSMYVATRIDRTLMRLSAHYRKTGDTKADYSVDAAFEREVARGPTRTIVATVDLRKSNRDIAAYIGFRALFSGPAYSVASSTGWQYQSGQKPKFVGEMQTSAAKSFGAAELAGNASLGRDLAGTYGRVGALLRTPTANMRADVFHAFTSGNASHMSASVDGALVFDGRHFALGAQDVSDAAILVRPRIEGSSAQDVEVIVDDGLRGRASTNTPLLLFLRPYELHRVRIRPVGNTAIYDSSETSVTTYPGQVIALSWALTSTTSVFGRLVGNDGQPIARARVESSMHIGHSDEDGYFQIEVRTGESLAFKTPGGNTCTLMVPSTNNEIYFDAGVQKCS